ncbi:DUF445 domain-containing protein [Coraliomargarita akajimensis]|uniref:DUF445 family protein n=1 Tax=Coraliomargarita akajimensis (strain DSM 45221 / IAM 15411 / JCM 23193 / KCTC 12865 / 04OKA010-24) TaxID=583355 RepID=D5EHQ8_CORAD|nr:DUF445 family protein [Coraliomargarita akajimensis]ADE54099.1 protein of unknown function DUF445 [Coraliomargarita akajimensis DSM 45221]
MQTEFLFILTPFITAAIGWLTNWVAIKMLFHPRVPRRIFFWKWQGLIPRRQEQMAEEAAEIIEREILQQHMILNEIKNIELGPYLEEAAHNLVWNRVGPELRAIPLLGGFINDSTLAKFEVMAVAGIKQEAGPLMEKVATEFESSVDLKQMIQDNIAAFDLERLESIVNQVAKREFRTIERLGAVLGFIIGCIQLILFWASGAIQF